MPPKTNARRKNAPAHQNTFAFKHNPNSKRTAAIMAAPIVHVCRRCHDKLAWRKQYRKYKPRTQPGKCNLCERRCVTAAYHTICEACTRTSAKAVAMCAEWNARGKQAVQGEEPQQDEPQEETSHDAMEDAADSHENASAARRPRVYRRLCAMCVKEPALQGDDDAADDDNLSARDAKLLNLDRPLKLRERKRLERLAETPPRPPPADNDDDEDVVMEDEPDANPQADPLLEAVGGVEQLLTGEAYQAKLLQQATQT